MKRLGICALSVAGLLVTQVISSHEAAKADGPQVQTNFISDDDGGVVQIVPVGLTPSGPGKANTAPVMKSIQQLSIFLGSTWTEQGARNREAWLSDLASHADLAPLRTQSVEVLPASPSVEDFTDLKGPLNDLTIQKKLVEMLASSTLSAPTVSTIFVVFLAPGAQLTVGNHTAGVHFAAYHNLVHVEEGELRYVVVPFNENASGHAKAATLAIVDTAFNPASN
jgi:hypothetical protein